MCGCGCRPLPNGEAPAGENGHCYARTFLTKAERAERLKAYAECLRKELAAVEEHIAMAEGG